MNIDPGPAFIPFLGKPRRNGPEPGRLARVLLKDRGQVIDVPKGYVWSFGTIGTMHGWIRPRGNEDRHTRSGTLG